MSYVTSQLLPAEQVRYEAHLHWMIFILPVFLVLCTAVAAFFAGRGDISWYIVIAPAVVTLFTLVKSLILFKTSEFAVTDKRVIIKVGWIQRHTVETILSKIEAIGVEQSVLGRLFGFGTITLTGTGGTQEQFERIRAPLEFRKQVHGAIVAAGGDPGVAITAAQRDERECPYCAERVLARAKVCKHCGRDLPATTQVGRPV